MINTLKEIFHNTTRSLEVLYVLENLKDVVRMDANQLEIEKIKNFCHEQRLFLEISDFKIIKETDKGKGAFSNTARKVPLNYPEEGLFHLYISKNKNKATFLKMMETKGDDAAVGEMLGYPQCCIDFFLENKESQQRMQNDYILPALKNSEGMEFDFHANYAVRYFDITLLSHFPHNFSCKDSINIAKKNLECIKKHSKELAEYFESKLKCAVLYTEHDGIFALEDYNLKNNSLEYKQILGTVNNQLLGTLRKNNKMEVVSKNEIKIGEEVLEDIGFMTFI
ncbi:hypothetical protein ISS07_05830 [Candidatus Woesearchaeota archaeon]|nr:hypothetical protein [Candidatus Woesearchaeota archaeon]